MKRLLYVATALSLLASCKEEISMDTLDGSPKLVVYCMPTVGDTTYIGVSRSVPVTKYNNTSKLTRVDNAHIDYTVNGQSIAVEHVGKGYYRVVGRQNAGDKIALKVQADGFESVRAATTIPQPVHISDLDYNYVRRYNDQTGRQETFDQITGTFKDDPNSHDHYAVRVKVKCYKGKATLYQGNSKEWHIYYNEYLRRLKETKCDSTRVEMTDSIYYYPRVSPRSEPLLSPVSGMDEDFGFSNNFFGNLYIFDDKAINGKTYTLHLDIDPSNQPIMYDKDGQMVYPNYNFAKAYQLELLRITPEYYNFLRSLNDLENNDLGQAGLSLIRPMQSNIDGGLGLFGGWSVASSGWKMRIDKDLIKKPNGKMAR